MNYIKAHNFWKKILSDLVTNHKTHSSNGIYEFRTTNKNERSAVWLLMIAVLASIVMSILIDQSVCIRRRQNSPRPICNIYINRELTHI